MENKLSKIEKLFDERLFDFLASLYDGESGGFYISKSAAEAPEYSAMIEPTGLMFEILLDYDAFRLMPEWFKNKTADFIKNRQNPLTGFFEEPTIEFSQIPERDRARMLSYARTVLKHCGDGALYHFPNTEDKATLLPDYMKSISEYRKYLKGLSFDENAWTKADAFTNTRAYMNYLPAERAAEFLREARDFCKAEQNPKTGLWGRELSYIEVSGAFKIAHVFFDGTEEQFPNIELAYESILEVMRENIITNSACTDMVDNMNFVRNPIDLMLLGGCRDRISERLVNDSEEIIDITYDHMMRFYKPDGGFSVKTDSSLEFLNGNFVPCGPGGFEGDINATMSAVRIRSVLWKLICGHKPVNSTELIRSFFTKIEKS